MEADRSEATMTSVTNSSFSAPSEDGHASLPQPSTMASLHSREPSAGGFTSALTPDQALDKFKLPKCVMPPPSELQPIETFVINAIQCKHQASADPSHEQGYRAMMDALKRPVDLPLLRKVLIALRTAGYGQALTLLTTHSSTHAQLVHWLFRFNATTIVVRAETERKEDEDIHLLDAHLHLILALISARTVHLVPALTAVWKMLSETLDLSEIL